MENPDESPISPEQPVRLEVTSQVLATDWVMMREINETEEEANHATYINNFGEIYSVRDLLGVGAFGVVLLVNLIAYVFLTIYP